MANIVLKNNAEGYLSTAISASDVGIALESGDGDAFPTLGVDKYFYATLTATDGTKEIVKVTARSGDSMTIVRAQEGTVAVPFVAGARVSQNVTAQTLEDAVGSFSQAIYSVSHTWSAAQNFSAGLDAITGAKTRWYNPADTNYHGAKTNSSNALVFDYNNTTHATINSSGVWSFTSTPLVGASAVYYAGGTDVPVADGGTGASTAAAARTNLGLTIGTDVQAYHAILNAWATASLAADKLVYASSGSTLAVADFPAFGRTLVANSTAADARTDLGLGSMATQDQSAVTITGGTIAGVTLQGSLAISSETSGTLTALSKNAIVFMTGNVQFNSGVFSQGQGVLLYTGSSSRQVTAGAGVTLRLGGTATTGTRTLAAYTFVPVFVVATNEFVVAGTGVS